MNVTVLADALAPVLRELVDATAAPILLRLAALEETVAKGMPALDMLRSEVSALPARFERQMAETFAAIPQHEVIDLAPIEGRCAALEKRFDDIPAPQGIDRKELEDVVVQEVGRRVAEIPPPPPGKSITADDVMPMIEGLVAGVFATMPVPKDGADVDPDLVRAMVTSEVREAVAAMPLPAPGKDADPAEIEAMVAAAVADVRVPTAKEVAALMPVPEPGKSVDPETVKAMVAEAVAKAVAAIPAPQNGVGLAGALIDRGGDLVVTLTDGAVVKLGKVSGEPGLDGIGFDDLDVVDGPTAFTLRFARGDQVKEWTLAKPTIADCYRGVWREGGHKAGDLVTWGGSVWLAQRDTDVRPEGNDDWRLIVKRGRDGNDLRPQEPKPPAPVKLK